MAQIEKNYTPIRPSSNPVTLRARALFSFLASKKHPPLVIGQIYGVLVIPFISFYIKRIKKNFSLSYLYLGLKRLKRRHSKAFSLGRSMATLGKWRKCAAFDLKINDLRQN